MNQPLAVAPPPTPPELPEDAAPRWPWWYAIAGFVAALIITVTLAGTVVAIIGANDDDPTAIIIGTLIQSVVFVTTAVWFASRTRRPRAWHFGLRPTPFWRALGWAAGGMVAFYVLAAIYGGIVQPDVEQSVAQDLGADDGGFGLIAAGFMIICVAPVAEEFFFRGFFYRALRSRWTWPVAAVIDGVLFGVIHYSDPDTLVIIPVLAALGFMFCLVFEKTGSIFPVIALHAINNSIAFASQADGGAVSVVLGPLMIAACIAVPALMKPAPAPRGV